MIVVGEKGGEMTYRLILLFLLLLWPGSVPACDQCEVVVEVLDGDSVVIQQQGSVRTVHLVSVDAPQIDQPYGDRAKQYTEELLLNRVVSVEYIW